MLLDSNILIYAAEPEGAFLSRWVEDAAACLAAPHHEAQVAGRCHVHPSGCLPFRQAQGPELAEGRLAMSLRSIPRANTALPSSTWKRGSESLFRIIMAPQILYHYFDASTAWECLKEGTLAFTPPIRFNDPFDYNPALNFEIRPEEREELARDTPKNIELTEERIQAAIKQNRRDFQEHLFGVFCLTTKENDPLMWAHYGDRHRGVVIGFDTRHADFEGVEKVFYTPDRPRAGITAPLEMTITKSDVWKNEHEWRLAAELARCDVKMVERTPVYTQRLERECFSSIAFGCRTEPAFMVALVNSFERWGLSHCTIWKAQMCDITYKLLLKKVSSSPAN